MAEKIKGILFDKDGTLLDFHKTWMPANRQAALEIAANDEQMALHLLEQGGWHPVLDKIKGGTTLAQGNNHDIALLWQNILEKTPALSGQTILSLEKMEKIITRIFIEASKPTEVCSLSSLFGTFKAHNIRTGVATADSEEGARRSLEKFDVLDKLDFIAGYDSGYGRKPEPGMVFAFCESTGLTPLEVAVVGDNSHDMEMAKAAGAGFAVGVLTGTSEKSELSALADMVLPSIAEININEKPFVSAC